MERTDRPEILGPCVIGKAQARPIYRDVHVRIGGGARTTGVCDGRSDSRAGHMAALEKVVGPLPPCVRIVVTPLDPEIPGQRTA